MLNVLYNIDFVQNRCGIAHSTSILLIIDVVYDFQHQFFITDVKRTLEYTILVTFLHRF